MLRAHRNVLPAVAHLLGQPVSNVSSPYFQLTYSADLRTPIIGAGKSGARCKSIRFLSITFASIQFDVFLAGVDDQGEFLLEVCQAR